MQEEPERDRDPGILTRDDRAYLRGEKDYSESTERNRRTDIRRRITDGVKDFELLAEQLEARDRKQVFEESKQSAVFNEGVEGAIYLLYQGAKDVDLDFAKVLKSAVHQAEFDRETQERQQVVEVDVEFDVEVSVERDEAIKPLVDKLRAEEPISGGQLSTLSTASEEIELDEPLDIGKVKLDGSTFISHFSDTTISERLLDPMLENWHTYPEGVDLIRE